MTAIAALIAIRLSAKPADDRASLWTSQGRVFSAVLEGVLIVIAAIAILREAYFGFLSPRQLDAPWHGPCGQWRGIGHQRRMGLDPDPPGARTTIPRARGRWTSPLVTDVVSSVGVLGGVSLAAITGYAVLDPALAAMVALNILWSGWRLVKESIGGLMDEAVPPGTLARIREIISANAEGAIEAHDLRTRHAGRMMFIDFHLVVPGGMSVSAAHDICDRLERAMQGQNSQML